MENKPHYFFALKLPQETKISMGKHFTELKELFPFKRWVHEEDLHITLAFLGSAPENLLITAKKLVVAAISDVPPFPVEINKLGVFGIEEMPRVFWAGIQENKELHSLRNRVYQACSEAGFQLESRPFSPHITLARSWAGAEPFMKREAMENWGKLQPVPLRFNANEVVLYQTHLDRSPKYEAIEAFPLK